MEEVGFVLTGIFLTGENWFCPNLNSLEKEQVSYGLTELAWNGGSRFLPV
jgi:hypothetical protein